MDAKRRRQRLYKCWWAMIDRCYNERNKRFRHYGGRGIRVWAGWRRFEPFFNWALSHGYADHLTIERRDNDKGYNPANCYWAIHAAQSRNRTYNRRLTAFGETKIMSDWARDPRSVIKSTSTIFGRLQAGWTIERILTTPADYRHHRHNNRWVTAFGETKILNDWARDPRCPVQGKNIDRIQDCISWRIKHGWPPEAAITTPNRRTERGA